MKALVWYMDPESSEPARERVVAARAVLAADVGYLFRQRGRGAVERCRWCQAHDQRYEQPQTSTVNHLLS